MTIVIDPAVEAVRARIEQAIARPSMTSLRSARR